MWTVLLWILVAYAAFWLWMFVLSTFHCPRCGVELPRKVSHPALGGGHVERCYGCGWRPGDPL